MLRLTILFALFHICLPSEPSTAAITHDDNIFWDILKEIYIPFERCLLKSIFDSSSPQINCSRTNSSILKQSELLDGVVSSHFPACHIGSDGFTAFTIDNGHDNGAHSLFSIGSTGHSCILRPPHERKSLRAVWSLDNDSRSPSIVYFEVIHKLLEVLHRRGVGRLVFVGDSVTGQLVKFFACDLLRTPGVAFTSPGQLLHMGKHWNDQSDTFVANRSHSTTLNMTLAAGRTGIPCNDINSSDPDCSPDRRTRRIFTYVKNRLYEAVTAGDRDRDGTGAAPVVVVFNAGLHISSTARQWMVDPIARALYYFAQEGQGKWFVLFRETSIQHFRHRLHGDYHGAFMEPRTTNGSEREYCCGPISAQDANATEFNWRNKAFMRKFQELSPRWREYVGWVDFADTTMRLEDAFVERGYDCTHFVYSPFLYLPLWRELHKSLEQLLSRPTAPPVSEDYWASLKTKKRLLVGSRRAAFVVLEGVRRALPAWNYSVALGFDKVDIERIDPAILEQIPRGPPVRRGSFAKMREAYAKEKSGFL